MSPKRRLHITTYGCQMNEYDSKAITGLLKNEAYDVVEEPEEASLILVNTCSVRQHAEDRAFSAIGRLSLLKKKNPHLKIGLCGCVAERLGANLLKRFRGLDLVVGPNSLGQLPDLLKRVERGERVVSTNLHERGELDPSILCSNKHKAFVPISFGCDNYCSYCIVPYVRGRHKSRRGEKIIAEIEGLVNSGTTEITLLGQNVNCYGKDLDKPASNFVDLLKEVNNINGLKRIRFITSHPGDVKEELIEAVGQLDKVCEHFHLPLQSGSNRILKMMRRAYDVETYLELVKKIRTQLPGVSITTDLIVGFPGEGKLEFEETLQVVKEFRLDGVFCFKYSPRPGTPAVSLPDQVPDQVKANRLEELIALQKEITRGKNQELIGTTMEVLVEILNPKESFSLLGRTRTDKVVILPGQKELVGQIVKVKIESAGNWCLKGGEAIV